MRLCSLMRQPTRHLIGWRSTASLRAYGAIRYSWPPPKMSFQTGSLTEARWALTSPLMRWVTAKWTMPSVKSWARRQTAWPSYATSCWAPDRPAFARTKPTTFCTPTCSTTRSSTLYDTWSPLRTSPSSMGRLAQAKRQRWCMPS